MSVMTRLGTTLEIRCSKTGERTFLLEEESAPRKFGWGCLCGPAARNPFRPKYRKIPPSPPKISPPENRPTKKFLPKISPWAVKVSCFRLLSYCFLKAVFTVKPNPF